jgi:hypothetical protein
VFLNYPCLEVVQCAVLVDLKVDVCLEGVRLHCDRYNATMYVHNTFIRIIVLEFSK